MALITLGTNATTTLQALAWNQQAAIADVASIQNALKTQNAVNRANQGVGSGEFVKNGQLYFPGRTGFLNLLPGDYVAFDLVGWPIVVSAFSIANSGGWTHS